MSTFPIILAQLPLVLAETSPAAWRATSLTEALVATLAFALAGIVLAIVGYKLFDACTPGNLHEEIVKNRNTAAAVIGAAIILGVCIVVAAAIMG
jgi:putative membrane protein